MTWLVTVVTMAVTETVGKGSSLFDPGPWLYEAASRDFEDGRHRATRHGPVDRSLYLPSASTAQPIGSDLDRLAA